MYETTFPEVLLRAENLCYTYESDTAPALQGLSVEIQKGRKIACMGSNGSGKSTFFLCCNGILKPASGTLYHQDKPYRYSKKGLLQLRKAVGIVFQDPDNQLFCASVMQEISFGLLNLGVPEEEARQRVQRIMTQLGITPFAHKPTYALSGGQKKLVAIADILVMEPELIILDEPVAALDPIHTQMVRGIIDQITREGITVMMATHDVDYAYQWADDVLLFHQGRILKQGTPAEIFTDAQLLEKVHLKPPAVISLFQGLREDGVFSPDVPVPRDFSQLRQEIRTQMK